MFIIKVNFNISTTQKHEHLKTIKYRCLEVQVQLDKEGMPNCILEHLLLDDPPGASILRGTFRYTLHRKQVSLPIRVTGRRPFNQQDCPKASFAEKFDFMVLLQRKRLVYRAGCRCFSLQTYNTTMCISFNWTNVYSYSICPIYSVTKKKKGVLQHIHSLQL